MEYLKDTCIPRLKEKHPDRFKNLTLKTYRSVHKLRSYQSYKQKSVMRLARQDSKRTSISSSQANKTSSSQGVSSQVVPARLQAPIASRANDQPEHDADLIEVKDAAAKLVDLSETAFAADTLMDLYEAADDSASDSDAIDPDGESE